MFIARKAGTAAKIPPHVYFLVSAIFHYLGPASAAIIGILVLHQIPTLLEAAGILLVAGGIALHKDADL